MYTNITDKQGCILDCMDSVCFICYSLRSLYQEKMVIFQSYTHDLWYYFNIFEHLITPYCFRQSHGIASTLLYRNTNRLSNSLSACTRSFSCFTRLLWLKRFFQREYKNCSQGTFYMYLSEQIVGFSVWLFAILQSHNGVLTYMKQYDLIQ